MKRSNLRYNSLNRYLKTRFGERVFKVTLDASLTCPNKKEDGESISGCIFCNEKSNLPVTQDLTKKSISEQLIDGINYVRTRHQTGRFISYFQRNTNTSAPAKELSPLYHDAISHKDVVGLAIATRPDCISDDVYELLAELNKETYLWVELGLQSANDDTLKLINRGHTTRDFIEAVARLKSLSIAICAHVIIGLPGEERNDVLNTAVFLNKYGVNGVKIHNLHILKGTALEEMYHRGEIRPLTLDEYSDLVIDMIENLSPEILIHRFNSHSNRRLTIAPEWSINKLATLNKIEEELEKRDSWQGKNFSALVC